LTYKKLVLIVDDEVHLCRAIEIALMTEDYKTVSCHTGKEAQKLFCELKPHLVLTDLRLPDISGLQVLEYIKTRGDTPVILMTAHASVETALEAMKNNAYDYILKPFNPIELKKIISNAFEMIHLRDENIHLKQVLRREDSFMGLIGPSEKMQSLFALIRRVADLDAAVLITGESGTGKEMAARAIHLASENSDRPFIAVNCGAISETLLESELFGHSKGAFTGAQKAKKGIFEAACGGTVFLDEIGEASQAVQVRLLRVLQEKEVRRVGEAHSINIDFRVIAATNRNLEEQVSFGKLRQDLYYRLDVARIDLPPLRERTEDIQALAENFAGKALEFTPKAVKALLCHDWPGNVRELQNVIKKAVIFSEGTVIDLGHLPENIQKAYKNNCPCPAGPANFNFENRGGHDLSQSSPLYNDFDDSFINMQFREAKQRVVNNFEKNYLKALLKKTQGVISRAAEMSGMDRSNFQKLLKKNRINSEDFRI
jgi:DNA-binding NtrC family response regulator